MQRGKWPFLQAAKPTFYFERKMLTFIVFNYKINDIEYFTKLQFENIFITTYFKNQLCR